MQLLHMKLICDQQGRQEGEEGSTAHFIAGISARVAAFIAGIATGATDFIAGITFASSSISGEFCFAC